MITIYIRRAERSSTPLNVRMVRKWGDPALVDRLNASAANVGDNFQVVKTATFGSNGEPFFNDISRYQIVDYDFLRDIQIDDYSTYGFTLQQKMNWLVNHDLQGSPSRPYWIHDGRLEFGPLVFGGQLIQIDPTPIVRVGQFPARDRKENITFYRLLGLRKSQMADVRAGRITHRSHPWLIQRATEAIGRDNKYNDIVRGEVFHPVWSDLDWRANYGDGLLYIAGDFLE